MTITTTATTISPSVVLASVMAASTSGNSSSSELFYDAASPAALALGSGDEEECIHITDAIREQGIDDVTSFISVKLLFTFVYGTLCVFGIIGNGGVLVAVAHNKRLRSARNLFLLNLMLTDLLLCLTGIPVTPWYGLHKVWVFGSLMCRIMPLSNSCAVFVTSWSLTAIAVDKYIHITDVTREPVSIRRACLITSLIWLICSLINIPYLMSYELVDGSYYVPANATPFCGQFCDEINWHGEANRRIYGSTVMMLQFVVPMAIITYCYYRILYKVHCDMIIQNAQFCQSLTSSQRVDAINRKKRVNYILIGMVFAFVGCWLPLTAVNLVKDFKVEPEFMRSQPYLWALIAHVIAMSTVVWNPLLFFWLTRKPRRSSLGKILHTSDIMTSLASRVHSFRSTTESTGNDASFRSRRRPVTQTSSVPRSPYTRSGASSTTPIQASPRHSVISNGTSVTRPLIVQTPPLDTPEDPVPRTSSFHKTQSFKTSGNVFGQML